MLMRKMIVVMGMVVLVLLSSIVYGRDLQMQPNKALFGPQSGHPRPTYKPGEIIVKFKETAADNLAWQLAERRTVKSLKLTGSLDSLNYKYKVENIEPVIKNFKAKRERIKALLKKEKGSLTKREKHLVRRLKRAPKGAIVPHLDRIYKIELEPGQSAPQAVAEYNQDPGVEYAELNYIYSIFSTEPNDPNYYPEQWALNNTGQSYPVPGGGTESGTAGSDVNAPEAWDITTGSSDIVVAVIDSGVDYNHPDLSANMWTDANGWYGYDFVNDDNEPMDLYGHGTHCAGIIAADGNNGTDIAGVCWTAKIMAAQFFDSNGIGYLDDAIKAIEYAVDNGADITSNSWGGVYSVKSLEDVINYAWSQGVINVAAVGNDNARIRCYPAYYDHTIAVAATDSDDQRVSKPKYTWGSNYGDWVDVGAPGADILSLRAAGTDMFGAGEHYYPHDDANATMYIASGTSMACPHVAGLAVLCLSVDSTLAPDEVKGLVRNSSDDLGDTGWDEYFGAGRINAYNAVHYMSYTPSKASNPFPVNGANDISINVDLSWKAAVGAFTQDVYFGTDYNEVNDANTSSDEFKGNQVDTLFCQDTLDPNTAYYWRIDEKNHQGTTEGDVWSFTTDSHLAIFYVDVDANSGGDGNSWDTAFNDLQDALDVVWSGDEIWVAGGTYKPTDTNDRTISFELVKDAAIYGGFAGTETSREQRNWLTYETILSGDINDIGNPNDNSYHVVQGADDAVLDGFIITKGKADGSGGYKYDRGGGMFNLGFSPIVRHCIFKDNYAWLFGGGMHNRCASAIVRDCIFYDNTAGYGGGMVNWSCYDSTIENCTFTRNTALFDYVTAGGAMHNWFPDSTLRVTNCIFWNTGDWPIYDGTASINYCDIDFGWLPYYGGVGNINDDPLFVDADANDFHLDANSPCIKAGDPNGNYDGQTDIDGDARVLQGRVDMGADETRNVCNITQKLWYFNIQPAINDADNNDIIVAYPGTYEEEIDFDGKAITVRGSDPNDWTVVSNTKISFDPNTTRNVGVTFDSNEDANSIISGLTIAIPYTGGVNSYGILCTSSPTIRDCIVEDNRYGIRCLGPATIVNNKVRNNSGQGISLNEPGAVKIENNWITGNGTAVDCFYGTAETIIRNNLIADNSGGMCFAQSTGAVLVRNNTIVDNGNCGILAVLGTGPDISNCVLWYNDDDLKGIYADCNATYSCIQDVNDANGVGNITSDPCFVDPNNGDFHLGPNSPCIDAGDPNFVPDTNETDIDGEPRRTDMDGEPRDDSIIDIGADEIKIECQCWGDVSGDEQVDVSDLALITGYISDYPDTEPPYTAPLAPHMVCADVNRDGKISPLDQAIIVDYLLDYPDTEPPYTAPCMPDPNQ